MSKRSNNYGDQMMKLVFLLGRIVLTFGVFFGLALTVAATISGGFDPENWSNDIVAGVVAIPVILTFAVMIFGYITEEL